MGRCRHVVLTVLAAWGPMLGTLGGCPSHPRPLPLPSPLALYGVYVHLPHSLCHCQPAAIPPRTGGTGSIAYEQHSSCLPRHREQRFGNALISFSPSIPIDDPFGGAVADPSVQGSYPWARPNVQREFSTPQMGQRPGLRSPVEPPEGAVGCSGVLPVLPQLWQKSGAKTSGLQGLREAAILLLTKDLSMHFFFLFF